MGRGHHREGGLAVPRRAHLRQEVEVVLENSDDRGVRGVEGAHELGLAAGEHRVEQLHVEAALAQHRRDEQRRERRIGFHLPPLLRVVCEVVGMREENLRPGSAHRGETKAGRVQNSVTWVQFRYVTRPFNKATAPWRSDAPSRRAPPASAQARAMAPAPPSTLLLGDLALREFLEKLRGRERDEPRGPGHARSEKQRRDAARGARRGTRGGEKVDAAFLLAARERGAACAKEARGEPRCPRAASARAPTRRDRPDRRARRSRLSSPSTSRPAACAAATSVDFPAPEPPRTTTAPFGPATAPA